MLLKDIEKNFPYLSIVQYGGNEYVGIINNQDNNVTSMYVYTLLRSDEEKKHFVTMNSKDVKVTAGPVVNIGNLAIKRVKRKSVQLVRKPFIKK